MPVQTGFAGHADRLARFEREAKVRAALSHSNIAGIFGLHEADGFAFSPIRHL